MTNYLPAQPDKPTLILVHGGWHGAWCWKKVLPLLEKENIKAVALDMPGQGADKTAPATVSFDDYVNCIIAASNNQSGPVILLGHSSAGMPIAQAAEKLTHQKVAALIFLDAFMPQNGESVFSLVEKFQDKTQAPESTGLATSLRFSDDQKTTTLDLDKVQQLLYHDCSEADIAFAKAHLGAQPLAPQVTPVHVTVQHYGAVPKFYILCTEARDFDKSKMANNVACQLIYRLPSSHSPFFSKPKELVGLIADIYQHVGSAVVQ